MKKSLLFYVLVIGSFAFSIWYLLDIGGDLRLAENTAIASKVAKHSSSIFEDIKKQFSHSILHPISILLLQIIIILSASRVFGVIAKKLGQPSVIGEIIAGIVLGPSLLGLFAPEVFAFIFPKNLMSNLQFLSQIGLALFMFIIGMELDLSKLKNKTHDAIVVSHASIILPYFLGVLLSYYVYETYAPKGVSFMSFALFMGIAMSITAFPVLARIIQERGLTKTTLGTLAITCAAADDVTAWCILAAVIAIVKAGSIYSALVTIGLSVAFVIVMLKIIK
jgi:Kef-type K+ transport system membrane component KefB